MSDTPSTFACNLGALSGDEQARRAALASRVSDRFGEIRELSDGYAARLDGDAALMRDALDWLLLERQCCPFMHLELSFEPSASPAWIRFRGAAGVKEFLTAVGFKARAAS
jgi:hypothetical protein